MSFSYDFPEEPSRTSSHAFFGEVPEDWDDPDGELAISNLLSQYPSLEQAYQLWESGATPSEGAEAIYSAAEQQANGISATTASILSAFCSIVGIIIKIAFKGKADAFVTWMGGICTLLYAGYTIANQPTQPPSSCPTPPSPCPEGQVWDSTFCRCIVSNALTPCLGKLGFVDLDGQCVSCGKGHHYDAEQKKCKPGCPEGWTPSTKWGCTDPGYNKPCTQTDGGRGVVNPDGLCMPDGCPEGQRFDFESEKCIGEGKPTGGDGGGETPSSGISGTSIAVGLLGVGVVAWAFLSMRSGSSAASAPTRESNPVDDETVRKLAREMRMSEADVRAMLDKFAQQSATQQRGNLSLVKR